MGLAAGAAGGAVTRAGNDYWGVEVALAPTEGFGAFGGETYTWVREGGNIVDDVRQLGDNLKDGAAAIWKALQDLFDPDTYNPWAPSDGGCPCEQ